MNILIIEDESFFADKIKSVFENKVISNRVKTIPCYQSFLNELGVIESYDLILVDILLSTENEKTGIDIIDIIRKKNTNIPIIIISSMSDYKWLQRGFDAGANDYIMKPFRLKELEIRTMKWFKTYFLSLYFGNDEILEYHGLKYNITENQFYHNGNIIKLTRKNKYILSIMLSQYEKLIPNSYLIEKIWGDIGMVIERNLRVSILRLRDNLEKYGLHNRIMNIRGEGYMLKKI